MANNLFFFFPNFHIHVIHLLAVFNSTTRSDNSDKQKRTARIGWNKLFKNNRPNIRFGEARK
jgi:hypothetical protein